MLFCSIWALGALIQNASFTYSHKHFLSPSALYLTFILWWMHQTWGSHFSCTNMLAGTQIGAARKETTNFLISRWPAQPLDLQPPQKSSWCLIQASVLLTGSFSWTGLYSWAELLCLRLEECAWDDHIRNILSYQQSETVWAFGSQGLFVHGMISL